MNYIYDKDLEFLKYCNRYYLKDDLDNLVHILIYDHNNKRRLTDELTLSNEFKKFYPCHVKYWKSIAAEIQRVGSNSIMRTLRGNIGVLYRDILLNTCKIMKVKVNKKEPTIKIEKSLIEQTAEKYIDCLNEKQKIILLNQIKKELSVDEQKKLGLYNQSNIDKDLLKIIVKKILHKVTIGSLQYQLFIQITTWIVISFTGQALINTAASQLLLSTFGGPVTLSSAIATTSFQIFTGPSYRITIPVVFHIASMRKKYKNPPSIFRRIAHYFSNTKIDYIHF